jgi:hypothetical protein
MEMSLDQLKKEYQRQKARVDEVAADPDSRDAKRQVRIGSTVLLVLGALFGVADLATWKLWGEVYVIFLAACPVLVVLGLIGLTTGKLPGARKR